MIKALTISQPFASMIASGEKFVENRKWSTDYRGPIAIHAGSGTQYLSKFQLRLVPHRCFVAVAKLVACIKLSDIRRLSMSSSSRFLSTRFTLGEILDHKHAEGPWCWVLEDVVRIAPITCPGSQGLWYPPREIAQRLEGMVKH